MGAAHRWLRPLEPNPSLGSPALSSSFFSDESGTGTLMGLTWAPLLRAPAKCVQGWRHGARQVHILMEVVGGGVVVVAMCSVSEAGALLG